MNSILRVKVYDIWSNAKANKKKQIQKKSQ